MSKAQHKLNSTETDNLISNLHGEVGDILLTWLILIKIIRNANRLRKGDLLQDFQDPGLVLLEILIDKLENDIVARLSELAEPKIGRLTFTFAQQKLANLANITPDVDEYRNFIENEKFKTRRNQFISHKQLPEKWSEHKVVFISMPTIGKCIALSVKLMIKIDKIHLGPSAIYLWREVLKKKGQQLLPLNVNFLLLPHMKLSVDIRKKIIAEEVKAGDKVWERVKAKVNGIDRDVVICKKWGALSISQNKILMLGDYPIIELNEINFHAM